MTATKAACFLLLVSLMLPAVGAWAAPAGAQDSHPRLFFSADDLAAVRQKAATTHKDIWEPILRFAAQQQPPRARSSADDLLEEYRQYGNRLIALAFGCVVSQDEQICATAKTYLLVLSSWEQWGELFRRDLGLSHMILGNSLAYDWLHPLLSAEERLRVRTSLGAWTQKLYEASVSTYRDAWANWWPRSYVQNHNWIDHSALGIAALTLRGEDARAELWLERAANRMAVVRYMLNGIGDGSWHEGIPYQSYGLTLSLPFLYNLRRLDGIDLIPHTYMRNYTYWRLYNHIPNGVQFVLSYGNFEVSWGNSYSPQNLLRFAASEYGDGHAEWLAQEIDRGAQEGSGIWSAPWHVLEFLYFDASIEAQPPDDLPLARDFPDIGAVIWRTGWGIPDMVFGLKSSAYGGQFAYNSFIQGAYPWEPPCLDNDCELNAAHDHDDALTFYIHRAGQWLAPEAEGVDSTQTEFHNSLLIDGQGQYRFRDDKMSLPASFMGSNGFIEQTAHAPGFDYVAADATRRYRNIPGVVDVTRHVLFVRPRYFVMLDTVTTETPHEFEWVSHFGAGATQERDWLRGDAGRGQLLGVKVLSPQPFIGEQDEDAHPYARIVTPQEITSARFINVLYPTTEDEWSARPTITLEADTGQAALVRMMSGDSDRQGEDVVVVYGDAGEPIPVGHYRFDGRTASVSVGGDGGLQELFVFGGTFLEDTVAGIRLVDDLDSDTAFQATYTGGSVEVTGSVGPNTRLYAPGVETLQLNGRNVKFARSGDYIVVGGMS